ncbi:berberine bridge enzyme-like 14 [Tripterygium wilfordii]|uniref:berberine bridge enzyme-like 14 n=1 Tax=Tripterygium wilfordii TaxID=458696 RepID=UPI0018F83C9A|nr:berberine bridge enzyme-like 14 [Tripterygium wilfordii]
MRSPISSTLSILLYTLLHISMSSTDPIQDGFLQCLINNSLPSPPISSVTYFPNNPLFKSTLQSYIRNLVFTSPTTPKPLFIVAPTHVSHIQASIICSKIHGLEIRIRSGGHDYDGLSYVSNSPFIILDMFNLRSISINIEDGSAWVESGATLGELFYGIGERSKIHGYPAGVCPTVGAGGHFSGGGYGNMMRKFGLTVDNIVDAKIVDVNGRILDRASMGEDLFWAIRGGGGASFGIIVSWKIRLVIVPESVTVFKVEKTLQQGATDAVYKWQYVAHNVDQDLFIRLVLMSSNRKGNETIKAKFVGLFLGNAERLVDLMDDSFPELGLSSKDCIEMSWMESVLFWSNYPKGTSMDVLLNREPGSEKFLKKKSDYVKDPIPKAGLEGLFKKMMELKKPKLTFNPYGGKMDEISESETPFPHRAGNIYKIQYSVNWKEEGSEAMHRHLDLIRRLYDYMTPYVSKSPRSAYLNYRDIDLGTNGIGNASYEVASVWGTKYFNQNFDRLVQVKSMVDPGNFFRYEQSIPSLATWNNRMPE